MSARRKTAPPSAAYLFEAPVELATDTAADGETKRRRFEGTAYSGGIIRDHWFWGDLIFDLSTFRVPGRLPVLLGHDRSAIVGYADKNATGAEKGLTISGPISAVTPAGADVAALSDEGFPWQMSVDIHPARVEKLEKGEKASVNGRNVIGPITIFRDSAIREVSFTPTGWDAETEAVALAAAYEREHDGGTTDMNEPTTKQGADTNGPSEAEQLAAANARLAELEARNAQFEQRDAERIRAERESRVKELFETLGLDYLAEEAEPYLAMSAAAFDRVAEDLKRSRPKADAELFTEQATAGADAEGDALVERMAAL